VKYSNLCVCMSVCLSFYLSAGISPKPHFQTLLNFLHMLLVAVARSSSHDNAVCYVLPVLSMTSCFQIIGQIETRAWSLRRTNYSL